MSIHMLPEPDDNVRSVELAPGAQTLRRDFVPEVEVGTYIACVFRVTGFDPDVDGSAMARLEQVDRNGEATGWEANALGLYPDADVVVDGPSDLHALVDPRHSANSESLARAFHETYERLAPSFSYETRKASAVPWDEVPDNNKRLMIAVAHELLGRFSASPWDTEEGDETMSAHALGLRRERLRGEARSAIGRLETAVRQGASPDSVREAKSTVDDAVAAYLHLTDRLTPLTGGDSEGEET